MNILHAIAFASAGLGVGFAVGATGVGGGSLMTPLLIVYGGVVPLTAVGTDLLYATITKVFAVAMHGRNRSVDWRIVALQALGSVPAAFATLYGLHRSVDRARLAHVVSLVLAASVLVTAITMLLREPLAMRLDRGTAGEGGAIRGRGALPTVAAGVLIGILVTISSVGAGVIGMLLLLWLYPRISPVRLIGSDLTHSVLITAIAGLGHVELGTVDYTLLWLLMAGGIPGIWLGSRMGFRLSAPTLRRTVAAMLLFAGVTTLAKSLAS